MTDRRDVGEETGLAARLVVPDGAGDGTPVLVLMHGRGADPSDLEPLRHAMPENMALVLPRAPHPGLPWGYGPGWAWYRYEGGTRPEPDSFETSQERLDTFLNGLADTIGFEPGPVLLGGFSQGGTMALGYALRHRGGVAGVMVFSGFLPDHPDVTVSAATVADTPIWWGHGTLDPAVRHAWAVEGRSALEAVGADLTARDYRMGHSIAQEELEDAMAWARARLRA